MIILWVFFWIFFFSIFSMFLFSIFVYLFSIFIFNFFLIVSDGPPNTSYTWVFFTFFVFSIFLFHFLFHFFLSLLFLLLFFWLAAMGHHRCVITRKKHPKIKLQRLRKILIWTFVSLIHQINSIREVLKLKQIFQKNKAITGKTPLLVIELTEQFWMEMMCFQS